MPGSFGTLTLNADGSYSYDGNPNVVPPAGATDVFVYTIKDGDGDTSTTTLTINLTDSGIVAPNDSDVTVNENALDTTALPDGSDLAVGTVTGSLPGSAAETDATNQLNGSGGTAPLTYALVSGGNAATAGTFGTIQVNADGSYVYTLTKPFDTSPDADNGANTEVAESFQYRVTDADGNSATGTITVNIVDDVPTAHADTNSVVEGADCQRQRADRRHRRCVRGGRRDDDGSGGRRGRVCGRQRHLFAGSDRDRDADCRAALAR